MKGNDKLVPCKPLHCSLFTALEDSLGAYHAPCCGDDQQLLLQRKERLLLVAQCPGQHSVSVGVAPKIQSTQFMENERRLAPRALAKQNAEPGVQWL